MKSECSPRSANHTRIFLDSKPTLLLDLYLVGGFNHFGYFPFHTWDGILPIDGLEVTENIMNVWLVVWNIFFPFSWEE